MNIIKSLEEKLKAGRKTLTEFQTLHLETTITYLKGLKVDPTSARKEYEKTMREHQR